jgi:hypothetical protein
MTEITQLNFGSASNVTVTGTVTRSRDADKVALKY